MSESPCSGVSKLQPSVGQILSTVYFCKYNFIGCTAMLLFVTYCLWLLSYWAVVVHKAKKIFSLWPFTDQDPCYSKCGLLTVMHITWELVKKADSQVGPNRNLLNQNLHFNKMPRRSICTLKFEKHWPRGLLQILDSISLHLASTHDPWESPPGKPLLSQGRVVRSNINCPVKFEYLINNKYFFWISTYPIFHGI